MPEVALLSATSPMEELDEGCVCLLRVGPSYIKSSIASQPSELAAVTHDARG